MISNVKSGLMQVSSDLSIIDLDIPFSFAFSISATMNADVHLGVLVFATWHVLLVSVPVLLLATKLQVLCKRLVLSLQCACTLVS